MYYITDTKRSYSYQDGFDTLESAITAARIRPIGNSPYLIADSNGRAWNLSGERIRK